MDGRCAQQEFGQQELNMALPFDIKKNATFVGMQAGENVITQIVQGRKTLGLIGGGSAVGKTYEGSLHCSPTWY
jgi:hypothetical protein